MKLFNFSLAFFVVIMVASFTPTEGRKSGDIIIMGGGGRGGMFGGGGMGDILTMGSLFGAFGDGTFIMGRRRR